MELDNESVVIDKKVCETKQNQDEDNSTFDQCCICWEDFEQTNVTILACGHKYHATCLDQSWNHEYHAIYLDQPSNHQFNKKCPYCKTDIYNEDYIDMNTWEEEIPEPYTPKELCIQKVYNCILLFTLFSFVITYLLYVFFIITPVAEIAVRPLDFYDTVGAMRSTSHEWSLYEIKQNEKQCRTKNEFQQQQRHNLEKTLFCWRKSFLTFDHIVLSNVSFECNISYHTYAVIILNCTKIGMMFYTLFSLCILQPFSRTLATKYVECLVNYNVVHFED